MTQNRQDIYNNAIIKQITEFKEKGFLKNAHNMDPESYVKNVWQNPINKDSMRVSKYGHTFLTKILKLESYKIELKEGQFWSNQLLLDADRYIEHPYAAEVATNPNKIVVYEERIYVDLVLRGGDIAFYIDCLRN